MQFKANGLQAAPTDSQAETPFWTGFPNLDMDNNEALAQSEAMAVFQSSTRCSFASKATLFIPGCEKFPNSCSLC